MDTGRDGEGWKGTVRNKIDCLNEWMSGFEEVDGWMDEWI